MKISTYFLDLIKRMLGIDYGRYCVRYGEHSLFIPTKIKPQIVWVNIQDYKCDGCCQTANSSVAYQITCDGIIFLINAESNCCVVSWYATI